MERLGQESLIHPAFANETKLDIEHSLQPAQRCRARRLRSRRASRRVGNSR
jgi:hypothetical protein